MRKLLDDQTSFPALVPPRWIPDSLMLASGTERYDRPDHRRGCDHYAGDDNLRIAAIAFIWRAPSHTCITAAHAQ